LLLNPQTPWNFSELLFKRVQNYSSDKSFKLCEVLSTDPELNFILKYFEHQKPPGYSIKRVVCIHNPDHTQMFESTLKNMEREASNPVFTPKGKDEEPKADRARVLVRWEAQASQFSPLEIKSMTSRGTDTFSKAKVLPLWHGSTKEVCQSICWSGFTSFGKHHYFDENALKGNTKSTDKGYFGAGIYFTNSAHYAAMYSSAGHLLLSWVSMREPYPVVNDKLHPQKGSDMIKLEGRMHYQNYNAHFIPVASIRPSDSKCIEYYPCYKDQQPDWDEFVVFHTSQALPRFWVELGVDFPNVALSNLGTAGELLTLLLSLLDKPDIQQHVALAQMLQIKADLMLEQVESTPLGVEDQRFLKLVKRLLPEGEKLSSATVNMLLKMGTTAPAILSTAAPVKASPQPISVALLAPVLSKTSAKPALPDIAFGKEKWTTYIGDVGEEPPLPTDIEKILKSPCPFWKEKKVEETHLLMLIPRTVNGKPYTLNYLEEFVKHPKQGEATGVVHYPHIKNEHGETPIRDSYWILFTKDVIPESRSKSFDVQVQLLKSSCQKGNVSYEVPRLLEAATSLFMEYLRTGKAAKWKQIVSNTVCQEKLETLGIKNNPAASNFSLTVGIHSDHLFINIERPSSNNGIMGSQRLGKEMLSSSASSHSSAGENTTIVNSSSLLTTPLMNPVLSKPSALSDAPLSKPLPPIPAKRVLPNIALNPIKDLSSGKSSLPAMTFGKALWEKYIGDVGVEPPLPADIDQILDAPCPFWPGKKVSETHVLVLIPQTVNEKPLNLKLLGELVQKPLQGNTTKYNYLDLGKYIDPAAPKSHWALMTRDVIEGTRSKSYSSQQALITRYSQQTKAAYEVPTVLDAAVCIFMEYVRTGTRLYSDSPRTYTRCQEKYDPKWQQLVVGGFSAAGLRVRDSHDISNGESHGVGGLRNL
jgi:hypothetical protein